MQDAAIARRVIPPHEIHFQCMVHLESETIIGYEALARFADGRSPQDHIAEAVHADQLVELELALLRSAVIAAEAIPSEYAVTLNASAETIDSPVLETLLPTGRLWGIELAETSRPESDDRLRRRTHDLGVLLLIDETTVKDVGDEAPPDRDLPVAWIKTYGKGRVFASTLGHTREAFKDPDIARMYTHAIAWSIGLIDGPAPTPHPKNLQQKARQ